MRSIVTHDGIVNPAYTEIYYFGRLFNFQNILRSVPCQYHLNVKKFTITTERNSEGAGGEGSGRRAHIPCGPCLILSKVRFFFYRI